MFNSSLTYYWVTDSSPLLVDAQEAPGGADAVGENPHGGELEGSVQELRGSHQTKGAETATQQWTYKSADIHL